MVTTTPKTRTLANGTPNDAVPVENNFVELYNNDSQLASAVTNLENNIIRGLIVSYVSASQIQIASGFCRNSTNTDMITLNSPITLSLTVSGSLGLDINVETANTWYYVYLIKRTSDGAVSAVFSVTNEAVGGVITLPSGYDQKRQLPIAIRNDASGNIIRFYVGEGWPNRPVITYDVATTDVSGGGSTNVLSAGMAGSFTTVDASAFVPPISRKALIMASIGGSSGAIGLLNNGSGASNGVGFGGNTAVLGLCIPMPTTATQTVSYMRQSGTGSVYLDIYGFVVTEL